MNAHDPHVGDKLTFKPSCFMQAVDENQSLGITRSVQGTVVYVNAEHRFYTAEGHCNGYILRESYKF